MTQPDPRRRPPDRPSGRPPPRTLWSDLRTIDRAIVPRLAALFERLRGAGRDLRPTVAGWEGGLAATAERLDGRYASRGLLGLVRDVPQVGLSALAVLLVVAASTVLVRVGESDDEFDDPSTVVGRTSTVGPFPGEPVDGYLADARARLARQAQDAPAERTFAIADFEQPVTAADAAAALPGVEPQKVFIRVRALGDRSEVFEEPTASLPEAASSAFVDLAGRLQETANVLARQAATITGTSPGELAEKASEERDVRHLRAQAEQLRDGCACIVAVVVRAPAQLLANIANSGKVRLVDPAEPDLAFETITWVPLLPEVKQTVPIPTTPPQLPIDPDEAP